MAAPEMKAIYSEAGRTQEQSRADLNADLKKLKGDDVDRFKAASAREFAGAERRLSMGALGAQKELADRQVQAQMGRAYGVQKHLGAYAEQAAKVTGRQSELARERGTFTAATRGTLVENQAKRNVQRRGQNLQNRRAAADRRARTQSQRADRAIRRQSEARQGAAQQETARHNRAAEANSARSGGRGGRGGKGPSDATIRSGRSQWARAQQIVGMYGPKRGRDGQDAIAFLTEKKSIDQPVAHAAVQAYLHRGVARNLRIHLARFYGVGNLPRLEGRPRRQPIGPPAPGRRAPLR